MSEYIERDIVLQIAQISPTKQKLIERIKQMPTADVAPVRHGAIKYIVYHNGCTPDEDLVCSACEESVLPDYNYCPNCGAKMDKDGDE